MGVIVTIEKRPGGGGRATARIERPTAEPGVVGPGGAVFEDGPAAGVSFPSMRLPWFVRVVAQPTSRGRSAPRWDVLDQLDDTLRPGEAIYVYRQRSWVHYRGHGLVAAYLHVPAADVDRCAENPEWRAYVDEDLAQRSWPAFGSEGEPPPPIQRVFACRR